MGITNMNQTASGKQLDAEIGDAVFAEALNRVEAALRAGASPEIEGEPARSLVQVSGENPAAVCRWRSETW